MKNDEKIDIKLSQVVDTKDMTPEEVSYHTALRYVNIAEHMKQFEDQDKYYHRAIQGLEKINGEGKYTAEINDLNRLKFGARAEGKINLYEEASSIRDNAKTPQDLYSAQTLFLRIAKYEGNHPIPEKWVTPEVYEKSLHCTDSAAQADKCEELALKLEAKQRRNSLIASFFVVAIVLGALVFSRTTASRQVLAMIYNVTGDYTGAYQKYNAVYERSGETDQKAYQNYLEARYKAAQKALKNEDLDKAYSDFKAVAFDDYKDSREQFFQIEQNFLQTAELSEIVHFANMDWRVLEKDEDRVLLIKDKALGSSPFDAEGDASTWADSSLRVVLNGDFLQENFYEDEINAIIDTEVVTTPNPYFSGVNPGENTVDKLYLLSVEEEEKYMEQLHKTDSCWWLRTPGAHEGSMAFVYRDRQPMPYGYEVTNQEITAKPVMWVSLK